MSEGQETCSDPGECSESVNPSFVSGVELTPDVIADLINRFNWHPPTSDRGRVHELTREKFKDFAFFICKNVPDGRERSLVLTKLEEALFWCNAGIARQ